MTHVTVTHAAVRKLAAAMGKADTSAIRQTDRIEMIAAAFGWRGDAFMHNLKTADKAVPAQVCGEPLEDKTDGMISFFDLQKRSILRYIADSDGAKAAFVKMVDYAAKTGSPNITATVSGNNGEIVFRGERGGTRIGWPTVAVRAFVDAALSMASKARTSSKSELVSAEINSINLEVDGWPPSVSSLRLSFDGSRDSFSFAARLIFHPTGIES